MKSYPAKVAVVVLFGLLGSLAFLNLINCNGEPKCCPEIESFMGLPQYLCLECAGGNETAFYCTVKFTKGEGEKKELCAPPKDFKSSIRNLNSGSALPPLKWSNSSPGIYQVVVPTKVDEKMLDKDRNTTFSLRVEGEEGCYAEKQVTIHAVKDGDTNTLDLNQQKPEDCVLNANTNLYDQNVKLLEVRNKSKFNVNVKHYGAKGVLIKAGAANRDFAGQPANGSWEAEIAEETVPNNKEMCSKFLQQPPDQRKITLELVLTCQCK